MGNIKHFDEKEVLEKILHVFWQKGYDATSLDDLINATDVKRQSLYNAFGKKEDMFLKAYEFYLQSNAGQMEQVSTEIPFREQVKLMLDGMVASQLDESTPSGCLVSNCSVEFGSTQSEMQQRLRDHFEYMEQQFHTRILQAQESGEIDKSRNAQAMAQFIISQFTAISVMYRLNQNEAFLRNLVNEVLEYL